MSLTPFENVMMPFSRGGTPEPGSSPVISQSQLRLPEGAPPLPAGIARTSGYRTTSIDPTDVDAFLTHLDTVFHVQKPNGAWGASRLLFEDHWHFDPARDPLGVFVAVTDTQDRLIVSSVRVYNRRMHLGSPSSDAHPMGGIGDVATNLDHRGKGFAKKLMNMGDEYMRSKGYTFGVLHAAPLAAPIYASIGWRNVAMKARVMSTNLAALNVSLSTDTTLATVRTIDFESVHDLSVLKALFALTAPSIPGTFARTDDFYWQNYVAKNRDPRRVVVRLLFTQDGKDASALGVGDLVGYAICEVLVFDLSAVVTAGQEDTEKSPISVQIKEFFAGRVSTVDGAGCVSAVVPQSPKELSVTITELLRESLKRLLPSSLPDTYPCKLSITSALLPVEVIQAVDLAWILSHEKVDEPGWMFKVFNPFRVTRIGDGAEVEIANEEDLEMLLGPVGAAGAAPIGTAFPGCEGIQLGFGADVFGFFKTDAF